MQKTRCFISPAGLHSDFLVINFFECSSDLLNFLLQTSILQIFILLQKIFPQKLDFVELIISLLLSSEIQ